MALSLISLAALADSLAAQAAAAKVLAPFAPEASAQHLKNARTIHSQIGALLQGDLTHQQAKEAV